MIDWELKQRNQFYYRLFRLFISKFSFWLLFALGVTFFFKLFDFYHSISYFIFVVFISSYKYFNFGIVFLV